MKTVPNYEECVKYALEMKGLTGDNSEDTLKLLIALGYKN